MNNETLKIKAELDRNGYGVIDYPADLKIAVEDLMSKFSSFCNQELEHKENLNYKNSTGYENRDKIANPDSVDHKESFYIKANYELPDSYTPSKEDVAFVNSCKELFEKIAPKIIESTKILSDISGTDLTQYFDTSALTLRAIHYYPDSNVEIAHSHVDRGGQTYHLYESTGGLESFWNGEWNHLSFAKDQMAFFPCIQAQYASKCNLKGLCHRVVSNADSIKNGRYSLVLFVDYNKLPFKYSFTKSGPIEKTFSPGLNYNLSFSELESYFEEKKLQFRKGVSALILNKRNEVLLVNLESFETKYFAIPGGGIDEGETLEDAVYREIKEELNLDKEALVYKGECVEPLQLIFKTKKLNRDGIEYDGMERHFFGFYYEGDDSDISLQEDEIRSYKWVAFNDLKEYLLFDNQLEDTSAKLLELFPFLAD